MRRVVVPPEVSAPSTAAGGAVHHLHGQTMGTTWSVKLAAHAQHPLSALQQGIQRVLDNVVAEMSTWEPDSDLSRFNRAAASSWVSLPPDCFRVLEYALRVARDSEGAYDPSAGALVDLWGFGPVRHYMDPDFNVPSAAQLAQARERTGWQRVAIDPTSHRALQPGGVSLDL